ncbi:MAG TPA: hypothetical protein VK680_08005 [Solirubrobacteraceae bacterium]|nr:hypothetical protein [Solirubrobacteraceae bacterium]
MAVHQQHVGPHDVTADFDVIGQRGEHPYAASAVQASRRLEVDRAPEQLVDERERLVVLHDAVALTDDPKHLAGVLTDGRIEAGDLLAARGRPIGDRRLATVDRDGLLRDIPAEPGRLDRLREGRGRSIEHGSQPVPRCDAHGEH